MSTMSPLLSWVEYYVWHSTQLNSWQEELYSNSTHSNQVESCTMYQCFCVLISTRFRKDRVVLCFRCAVVLHTRSVPSRIQLQIHVKVTVLLFSIQCVTMAKVSQKILRRVLIWKIHGLVFTTRVEVLKMSWSVVADTHKSWPSWLWSHNPPPQLPFWRPIVVVFRCSHSLWESFGNKEFEDGLLVKTVILTSKKFARHFFTQFISY
jgi:hypothetical protein